MTTTPPAEADHIQDQLCARIDELEAEKLALIDENERLRQDNEEIRKQLTSMRCP